MASIVFGDYRLIKTLTDACSDDIGKLACGRLDNDEDDVRIQDTFRVTVTSSFARSMALTVLQYPPFYH